MSGEFRNSRSWPQSLQRPWLNGPAGVSITQWWAHSILEIIEVEEEEDDSLINQPLIWIPLGVLTVAGLGIFAYSRLGDGGDYFDDYDTGTSSNNTPSTQSGFRYDPVTGNTYDSQTGEIIQQGGKEKD